MLKRINTEYLRSVLFGIEDGLVSTTGVVVGISVGSGEKSFVLLAGLVAVAVEALSMGAGEFLSEEAVHEMDKKHKLYKGRPVIGGILMFISYFLAGLIPILPVILFPLPFAMYVSIFAALLSLFTLGYVKGKVIGTYAFKSAIKVLTIGGLATILGLLVGTRLQVY